MKRSHKNIPSDFSKINKKLVVIQLPIITFEIGIRHLRKLFWVISHLVYSKIYPVLLSTNCLEGG